MDTFSLVKRSVKFCSTLISTHETRMYCNMKAGTAVKFTLKSYSILNITLNSHVKTKYNEKCTHNHKEQIPYEAA
jgi:hypothetical protein